MYRPFPPFPLSRPILCFLVSIKLGFARLFFAWSIGLFFRTVGECRGYCSILGLYGACGVRMPSFLLILSGYCIWFGLWLSACWCCLLDFRSLAFVYGELEEVRVYVLWLGDLKTFVIWKTRLCSLQVVYCAYTFPLHL